VVVLGTTTTAAPTDPATNDVQTDTPVPMPTDDTPIPEFTVIVPNPSPIVSEPVVGANVSAGNETLPPTTAVLESSPLVRVVLNRTLDNFNVTDFCLFAASIVQRSIESCEVVSKRASSAGTVVVDFHFRLESDASANRAANQFVILSLDNSTRSAVYPVLSAMIVQPDESAASPVFACCSVIVAILLSMVVW